MLSHAIKAGQAGRTDKNRQEEEEEEGVGRGKCSVSERREMGSMSKVFCIVRVMVW